MPPKRRRPEDNDNNKRDCVIVEEQPTQVTSLEFLCCAVLTFHDPHTVCSSYKIKEWKLPRALVTFLGEQDNNDDNNNVHPLIELFLRNIQHNPRFGWCTLCLHFSMVNALGRVSACRLYIMSNRGHKEPFIDPKIAHLLLQWGHTHTDQRGAQWLHQHSQMLMASDAAVPLGCSSWSSVDGLFQTKLGFEKKEFTDFAHSIMDRGTFLKPEAITHYKQTKGR
jgi:hypothetical protein